MASRFAPLESFISSDNYQLLPFNFEHMGNDDYYLTNLVGESKFLKRDVLNDFVGHHLLRSHPDFDDLSSRHFLAESAQSVGPDLLALKMRTKLERISDFTSLHIFVVTLRCEHSCPYCQVSRQKESSGNFDMSEDTASRALEFVFRSPSENIKIEFQGGESMLNFPLVKYIVHNALQINIEQKRSLQFVLATNLAVVTDEILEYCYEFNILISTSLDGPADLHNHNRPRAGGDSHTRAIAGIKRARRILGHDRVGALMTTTKASLTRVDDIIEEYDALGFNNIFLRPLSPYGFAIKTKNYDAYEMESWLSFYFEGLEKILRMNSEGRFFVETYAAIILKKMLTPFGTGYVDLRSPAGVGIAAIVYNYDGDIYPSDESRMLVEMGDRSLKLGNVHQNSWEEVITSDTLLSMLEDSFTGSAPMCSDCAFEPFCGSDPTFHYATQGDYVGFKPLSAFCTRTMAVSKFLVQRMRDDKRTEQIFRSWVQVG